MVTRVELKSKNKNDIISIGSDPEFMIVNPKTMSIIDSHMIFPQERIRICNLPNDGRCYKNGDECKVDNLFCGKITSAPIGTDGEAGELRPNPCYSPLQHIEEIQHLLHVVKPVIGNNEIRGGTIWYNMKKDYKHYIGGHIHIGMPGLKSDDQRLLALYMSYYVGIPLHNIEVESELKYRGLPSDNYGYYGRFDTKSYGIEFRMPASWLISKEIATFSLCLAHTVANEFYINKSNISDNKYMLSHDNYQKLVVGNISEIISDIEQMNEYPIYKREIEPLIQLINNNQKWNPTINPLEYW